MRGFVEKLRAVNQLAPATGWLNIDLDDAGVRRHTKAVEPRIFGRLVALQQYRLRQRLGGRLDRGDELQIVFRAR